MNRTVKAVVAALMLAVGFAGSVAAGPLSTPEQKCIGYPGQDCIIPEAEVALRKGDLATALRLFHLLAEQGDAAAQFNLGQIYELGLWGVPQDYATAAIWYRKAAEQGNAAAQLLFALMYEAGDGVPQDYVFAHMWVNLAAASGNKMAVEFRDKFAREMTRAQIAEAQKLAREWKPK